VLEPPSETHALTIRSATSDSRTLPSQSTQHSRRADRQL